MNYKEEIKEIEKEQTVLANKAWWYSRLYKIERYREQSSLIGKCFVSGSGGYFKIIDLEENNEFRCIVLTFKSRDIELSIFNEKTKWSNYNYPEIDSWLIRDIIQYTEINEDEFDKALISRYDELKKICLKNLNDKLNQMKIFEERAKLHIINNGF